MRLDNLAYAEFKQMVLHFRRAQANLPTAELWTKPIDELAQHVMDDFTALQGQRTGDLDRRALGLSPALLEEARCPCVLPSHRASRARTPRRRARTVVSPSTAASRRRLGESESA